MFVFDVIQSICNISTFSTRMNLLLVNKYLHDNLRIFSFYDSFDYFTLTGIDDDPKISCFLTGDILKRFKHLKILNLTNNQLVHDCDIMHLNLDVLFARSSTITNYGIKHMNLHTLDASYCNITSDGIKHMDLVRLYASYNIKICDDGIKHMDLDILEVDYNDSVTSDGIKHMNLHFLSCFDNGNITAIGIKHMKMDTVFCDEYSDINHFNCPNIKHIFC